MQQIPKTCLFLLLANLLTTVSGLAQNFLPQEQQQHIPFPSPPDSATQTFTDQNFTPNVNPAVDPNNNNAIENSNSIDPVPAFISDPTQIPGNQPALHDFKDTPAVPDLNIDPDLNASPTSAPQVTLGQSGATQTISGPISASQQPGSQQLTDFEKFMCRERRIRLDYRAIMAPCKDHLEFGRNMYSRTLATHAETSQVLQPDIQPTGEYTRFRIRTLTKEGVRKDFGGDAWRVFISGPANIEPFVHDLMNGDYEVAFLVLEPGRYVVKAFLEGTLCGTYVNPPNDWFMKGDYNGHFQESWMWKDKKGWPYLLNQRQWSPLSGSSDGFYFDIPAGDNEKTSENLTKIKNWKQVCSVNINCEFLNDGFGRWIKGIWNPYVDVKYNPEEYLHGNRRHKQGMLWMYGDCYAHNFYDSVQNTSLCHRQFAKCNNTYNWVYPRWNVDPKKDDSIHLYRDVPSDINIIWLVDYFKEVLEKPDLNKDDGGMLLNLGLHFLRSTTFQNYQKVVDGFLKVIKDHRTSVVWRSTTAIYKPEFKVHKRFQTYTRAMLFNAYSMATMCKAGVDVIDVFPMTSSYPHKPSDGIHFDMKLFMPVREALHRYFRYLPSQQGATRK